MADYTRRSQRQNERALDRLLYKLRDIHPNVIDCSDVFDNYKGNEAEYKFICPKHGPFYTHYYRVAPGPRSRKVPCPKCNAIFREEEKRRNLEARKIRSKEMSKRDRIKFSEDGSRHPLTEEEYLNRLKLVWGDEYDLSKVKYTKQKDDITVGCKHHGDFTINARTFMRGSGCPKCGRESCNFKTKKPVEEAEKELAKRFGSKLTLLRTTYDGATKPADFRCYKHGVFTKKVSDCILTGCPECIKEARGIPFNEFVRRGNAIHNHRYTYSKEGYINTSYPVKIRCSYHGWFYQNGQEHLRGRGCRICLESHGERMLDSWLKGMGLLFEREVRVGNTRQRFDFVIDNDILTVIEWDGGFHRVDGWRNGALEKVQELDATKDEYVTSNGGVILRLRDDDEEVYVKLLRFLIGLKLKRESFINNKMYLEYKKLSIPRPYEALYTGDGIVEPI